MIEPMYCKYIPNIDNAPAGMMAEPKLDGIRAVATKKGATVEIRTRNNRNVAAQYPEIVAALKEWVPVDFTIDGELTVAGGFTKILMRNVQDAFKIRLLSKTLPATYNVFDVLMLDGRDFTGWDLFRRKAELRMLPETDRIKFVPYQIASAEMYRPLFDEFVKKGFEGIVLKEPGAKYESGQRTGKWLKHKMQDTVDVQVIGMTVSDALPFGALIIAKDGKYYGKVGTGFTIVERYKIAAKLQAAEQDNGIALPPEVSAELLSKCRPMNAEITIQEEQVGSPRFPVWVRFRAD